VRAEGVIFAMEQVLPFQNKQRWLIFGVTAIGTFMSTLDASIVNVALPEISASLHSPLPLVQWVVSAYLLSICCLLPLFGRAGDMFGRRRIYSLGVVVFTIGSVFCGSAFSIFALIAARIAQGVGAAMLMSNAPAIVAATFTGPDRGRALGMVGMIVALGSMTGPTVGGFLVDALGWKSIFYVNVPIGIFGVLAALALLPKQERLYQEAFDFIGAILFAVAISFFLLIVSHGQEWGWSSPTVIGLGVTAVLTFSAFIYQEKHTLSPMIDLKLFEIWTFLSGNITGLLSFMAIFCNTMLLPFYLASILHLPPAQIGLLMTPFPLLLVVVAPISGYLSEQINPAILSGIGLVVTTVGLAFIGTLDGQSTLLAVVLGQALLGLGNGLFQSPNNNSVMSSVPLAKLGIAGGINALVRNVGMVCGIAFSVSIFENRHAAAVSGILTPSPSQEITAFLYAYHIALTFGACLAGISALLSFYRSKHIKAARR
jgi:EmrB/QacA subfamily drug resistance transporter